MGHNFYGGCSRCFQKSIPGKVRFAYTIFVGYLFIYTCLTCLPFLSQTCPLDLYTDCFYENRKEAIECRVQLLSEASVETLHGMLEDVWTSQEGKVCSLVNWERFSSLQQAKVFTVTLVNIHTVATLLGAPVKSNSIQQLSHKFHHYKDDLCWQWGIYFTIINTFKFALSIV